jgi:hypothetical protein
MSFIHAASLSANESLSVAGFEVSVAMKIQVAVFWFVTPCGDVTFHRSMLPPHFTLKLEVA